MAESIITEQWRNIPGYEGIYEVSNLGRVRSIRRMILAKNRWGQEATREFSSCILKQQPQGDGRYLTVFLRKNKNTIQFLVHRLVASAFMGPCPIDKQVNHSDGDK